MYRVHKLVPYGGFNGRSQSRKREAAGAWRRTALPYCLQDVGVGDECILSPAKYLVGF